MKLMRLLKKSTDKTGRVIAVHFLDLPSKNEYPLYYTAIKMPISLNMVEKKLQSGEYPTMETLESDLKRLVQNAKEFNSTKSEVYEDAERIRKALSNFMPKHNPAYLDSTYRAYPTPIPSELLDRDTSIVVSTPGVNGDRSSSVAKSRRKSSAAPTENDDENNDDKQTSMIDLLAQLMERPDAVNFYEKPPRKDIPDYYKVIKRPTAILEVKKGVERGKIQDWETFAAEVGLIWTNAKEYNEDGSEIYEMASELEVCVPVLSILPDMLTRYQEWFNAELDGLGVIPKKPKITLKQPKAPSMLVKFTRSTPNPAGGMVDQDALRRQKEETGQALSRASGHVSLKLTHGSTPVPIMPANLERSGSASGSAGTSAILSRTVSTRQDLSTIKPEASTPVPTPTNHVSRSFPTPVDEGLPPQYVNPPAATYLPNGYQQPGYAPVVTKAYQESDNPIERKFRDPGKGIEDALLSSVTFMTHPKLPNDPKWKLARYASPSRTQTSSYIYLPSDHYYLRVVPHLSDELRSRKRHKLCLTRNWESKPETQEGSGIYDFRILPGINEICVDVISDLKEGERKDYAPPQLQLDFERIRFVVVLREASPE
jgi:Bromodomain